MSRIIPLAWVAVGLLVAPSTMRGQSTGKKAVPPRTTVQVELVTNQMGAALAAQEWARLFSRLNVPLRVRRALVGEKPAIREKTFRGTRQVTVVGRLNRSGRVTVPGQRFTPRDFPKLKRWIAELKTYGASGSPAGKPVFGLSESQFSKLFAALGQPAPTDLAGQQLEAALVALKLPVEYPVSFSPAAVRRVPRPDAVGVPRHPPVGPVAIGSMLAILLNDHGLGFRPRRTPAGRIELMIDAADSDLELWPIGWPPQQSPLKTAPPLYKIVPVNLNDVPFTDTLNAISRKTGVPILVDRPAARARGVDIDKLLVSHPDKKTSWSQLLKALTNPHRLTRQLRIDERGRPFVWVTTIRPRRITP